MRVRNWIVLTGLMLVAAGSALADYLPLRYDTVSDQPEISLLYSDAGRVEFEVRIPGIERLEGTLEGQVWDRFEIPGGGFGAELGNPEAPTFNRMVAVPANKGVRVEFEALDVKTLTDIHLIPAQGRDIEELSQLKEPVRFSSAVYNTDDYYPAVQSSAAEPAIMRGVRLVNISTTPVRYNPVSGELQIAHRYKITVYFEGTDERNNPQLPLRPMSKSWAKLMEKMVVNFDELDVEIVPVGDYLIVCENDASLINNLLPNFVDWKTRKGHNVNILTFNAGFSNFQIKSLIQNYYDTAEIPPEFVLLIGDVDGNYALPGWPTSGFPPDQTDHEYSLLEGGDVLADVAVGRMPADDNYEAAVLLNKVLFYEKMPFVSNTDWYHQGCVIAGNSYSGISTIQTNRYIKTRMIEHEFTRIDTFWYWMGGSVYNTTTSSINNGISCFNYRGNYEMQNFNVGDISYLTNTYKLPFVVTITCDTGGFSGSSESFMERFAVVGTPNAPTAAIAAVGTASWETHTRFNNTIAYGIWSGIFDEGITNAGNALNRGKLELYNTFIGHDQAWAVPNFCEYAALAGDPGVDIFNAPIQFMTSNLPASMSWGENSLTLTVNHTGVGALEEALVCYYKDGDIHEVGMTNENGQVILPLNLASAGNVKVTVTKNNFHPIVDSLNVIQSAVTVGYYSHSVDDDASGTSSGDGDSVVNPNEMVEIPLTFKNFGSSTPASSVVVTATSDDEYITITDDTETFPNMAPGATNNSLDDLDLTIAADCPDGHIVHLALTTTSGQGAWEGGMDLEVVSSAIDFRSVFVGSVSGDTVLTAGSAANFGLNISNNGGKNASSLTAILTSLDALVTVNDNAASFGTVTVGSTANCSINPFNVTAGENSPPGYRAQMQVVYTTSSGAVETDTFEVAIGVKTSIDPQGPDSYGYYCFDNTDLMYQQAPIYNWVEIDPTYGGLGTQLGIIDMSENNDMSVMLQLPFTFRYYGEDVNSLTVCSNGWIATHADASYADFRNYRIPSIVGPRGMIAPFWDDLVTTPGHVFAYHDAANHRFIIQWSGMECGFGYGYNP
ncbi:MAG: C25 family cysteine peptidase, partial [bacterium]